MKKNLLIIWDRMGEYHWARIRGLVNTYKYGEIHIAEYGEGDTLYQWGTVPIEDTRHHHLSQENVEAGDMVNRLFAYLRIVKRSSIEVVIIPGYSHPEYVIYALINRLLRVKTILFAESWYPNKWWIDYFKRLFLNWFVDGLFVSGSRAKDFFHKRLKQPLAKIMTGYSVVDNAHFETTRASQADFKSKDYIVCVARYSPEKDLMTLIKAYRNSKTYRRYALWLVGDGPLRHELRTFIGADKEWILLKGWLSYEALPQVYQNALLCVLSSSFEPWGLVVNEAMAAGVPVICSEACGCVADLIKDDQMLFPVGDHVSLQHKIDHLCGFTDQERSLIVENQKMVISSFDPVQWALHLIQLSTSPSPN